MLEIKLNDRVVMISGDKDELSIIKKSQTYDDTSACMTSNGYDSRKAKKVCLLKTIDSKKVKEITNKKYLVGFAGLIKEILLCCRNNKIKVEFTDERTHFDFQNKEWTYDELRGFFDPKFKYVDHQVRTLQAMLKTNKAILKLPTSAGKSSIMAAWMKLTGLPTLILTDRATLGAQLAADFNEKGIDCGFCSGKGYKKGFCVVSTIQSVKKVQDLSRFKMILHDECFPASQKIIMADGNKKLISQIKEGDLVKSYNESTRSFENKKVISTFNKKTNELCYLYTNKTNNVKCTLNHPFYVYNFDNDSIILKEAKDIQIGEYILSSEINSKKFNSVPAMLSKKQKQAVLGMLLGDSSINKPNNYSHAFRMGTTQGDTQLDYLIYKNDILNNICTGKKLVKEKSGYNSNKIIWNWSSKCSYEFTELYNKIYINGIKTVKNIIKDIDEISLAFWVMDDGCLSKDSNTYTLMTQSFSEEDNILIKNTLKEKFNIDANIRLDKRCNKNYLYITAESSKKLSSLIKKYICPSMQYKLIEKDRGFFEEWKDDNLKQYGVKKVLNKVIKKEERVVYNFGVEDNHNYILSNGMVVHNCHKGSAKTFQDFNASFGCPLKYGFSASPSNGNYLNFAKIRQHYGSIYIDVSAEELIDNEVMAKPKIHIVKNICSETFDYPSAYDSGIVHNDRRNETIKNIADKYERGCAILVTSLEHGELLEKNIEGSKFISGSTPMEDRKAFIKMFNEGELRVLIGSTILNEGISIPNVYSLIQAGGQKSTTQTIQKIGRALRITKEKKEADFYDFWDMGNKFLIRHSKQRLGLYKKEGYKDFNVLNSDLEVEKDLTVK